MFSNLGACLHNCVGHAPVHVNAFVCPVAPHCTLEIAAAAESFISRACTCRATARTARVATPTPSVAPERLITLPEAAEVARRFLAEELEAGDLPTVRRSLQVLGTGGTDDQLAGSQVMQHRWQELLDKLKETVYLHDDDYYTQMRDGLYNVEWCLRTLVPWRMCMYPRESPPLPGGDAPKTKPTVRRKGVYKPATVQAVGRSTGYARP